MNQAAADSPDLFSRLAAALEARRTLLDPRHRAAVRLFAGFYEGARELVADLYADTLLLHNYADPPLEGTAVLHTAARFYADAIPGIRAVVTKPRHEQDPEKRRGEVLFGTPAREVTENSIRYGIDVLGRRDAGFFLDTRNLRSWARSQLAGKTVLNTFAYTGSLGVAAAAGGASHVVHLDHTREVLNVAKTSYTLNGLPVRKADFVAADFWVATSRWRRSRTTFDALFLDPPVFASSSTGVIDLQRDYGQLINKVRPLVAHDGLLVVVNNAVFLSGAQFMQVIEEACADDYLALEQLVPVPPDVTGFPETVVTAAPVSPRPFNHPTKIAILKVRRRDTPDIQAPEQPSADESEPEQSGEGG